MIPLAVPGDPAGARITADDLRRLGRVIADARAELNRTSEWSARRWEGTAAENFRTWMANLGTDVEEFSTALSRTAANLDAFAHTLESARERMATARELAIAHGLTVADDTIVPGPAPALLSTPMYNPLLTPITTRPTPAPDVYAECLAIAEHGRVREADAHELLRGATAEIAAAPFLLTWLRKAGIIPETHLGVPGVALWGGGLGTTIGGSIADWMIRDKYGRFAPRNGGRYISPRSLSWPRTVWAKMIGDNWQAKSGNRVPFARATSASRWLGRAGGVVSGGVAALDQWQSDAGDPTIGDTERVARAATQGVGTGVGAYGGAWAGAQVGATIGTAIGGPVGTVAGGLVGGLAGGLIGSEAGGAMGEALDGLAGDSADYIAGGVSKGWDATTDKVSDFGDAVSFWN